MTCSERRLERLGNAGLPSRQNIPVVVTGDAHGAFKFGRRIGSIDACPTDPLQCNTDTGPSMTKLLVSVAIAFGEELYGFRTEPDVGALSELEA